MSEGKGFWLSFPCEGELIQLEVVDDELFSGKIMGDGFAIKPSSRVIKAPIDGFVSMIASTRHAFGIENDNGLEMLIHIGIDTVLLEGEGFTYFIVEEDFVKQGDPIVRVDFDTIIARNLDPVVLCIFTNRNTPVNMTRFWEHVAKETSNHEVWIDYD